MFACIVSSSCAKAKGSGAQLPTRPNVAAESFVFGMTPCAGIGVAPVRWGFLVLLKGVCAGRTLSAEEVCWGFGSGWGFLCLLWFCL